MCDLAIRSYSYFNGTPYPSRANLPGWNKQRFGDYPGVLPLVFNACQQQTEALIGKGVLLSVPGDRDFEEFLRVWQSRTRFSTRIQTAIYKAFNEGSVVLHFYLSPKTGDLQFRVLSSLFETIIEYDEFDPTTIVKATIVFPTFDKRTNTTKIYIQQWTATTIVTYKPTEIKSKLLPYLDDVGVYNEQYHSVLEQCLYDAEKNGTPISEEVNPFGLVPFVEMENLPSSEDTFPRGDCWKVFNLLDRVNIGYHLMNAHAQNAAIPGTFLFDATVPDDMEEGIEQIPSPGPGEVIPLQSRVNDDGTVSKGNIQTIASDSKIYEIMNTYVRDLVEQVQLALGAAFVSGDEFTNKGMLTSSILQQLFRSLVTRVETKRITLGDHGLIPFFTLLANAISNLPAELRKNIVGLRRKPNRAILELGSNQSIFIRWPEHFSLTQQELSTQFDRLNAMVETGLISPRRALETLGNTEGWEDVDDLVERVSDDLLDRPEDPNLLKVSKNKDVPPMKAKSKLPEVNDRT